MGESDEKVVTFEPELEILWCIKKLESIVFNEHAPAHKVKTASKALKTLKNRKASLVKKRSVMHTSCTGYRKSMLKELEEAKSDRPKVSVNTEPKVNEGFVRKHAHVKKELNYGSKESTDEMKENIVSSFCFNFPDPSRKACC